MSVADAREFDLALIDRGLPDMEGLDGCRELRTRQPGCILVMLTGRDEEIDVVLGLEAGADDYLTKPFRVAELMARVSAHLRRAHGGGTDERRADESHADQVLTVGDLEMDLGARRTRLAGADRSAGQGVRLVAPAGPAPDVAVSRTTLMTDVWNSNWFGSTKTLDVHIASLRKKLAAASSRTGTTAPEIVTLRAHGFRLEAPRSTGI